MHHNRSGYFWGILLILIGVLFLLHNWDYLHIGEFIRNFWPVLLIAIGTKILLSKQKSRHRLVDSGGEAGQPASSSDSYQTPSEETYNNVFDDVRLRFDGKSVQNFFVNNVFGDIDLDFNKAKFKKESRVKVHGIFGDVDIRLPQDVALEVSSSFVGGSARIIDEYQSGFLKNVSYHTPDRKTNQALLHLNISVVFGDIHVFH